MKKFYVVIGLLFSMNVFAAPPATAVAVGEAAANCDKVSTSADSKAGAPTKAPVNNGEAPAATGAAN